jgi:serine/threonine-protein kinase RsbW
MKRHRDIKVKSSLDEMYRIEQFVEGISDDHMLYGNYFGNIMMAVTEAFRNAVLHGNRQDSRKIVRVVENITPEGLWVSVTDEGEGFDFESCLLKDGLSGFESDKTGLVVIQKLCDAVKFRMNGRSIEMLFRINGIDEKIFNRREAYMQDFFKVYQHLSI